MGFGSLGIWEILLIAVLVLIFFGPQRLPEIARSAGQALREFKRGVNEIRREFEEAERSMDGGEAGRGGEERPQGRLSPGTDADIPTFAGDREEAPAEGGPADRRPAEEPPRAREAESGHAPVPPSGGSDEAEADEEDAPADGSGQGASSEASGERTPGGSGSD